ncbi:MAG TPA: guanylate kinase [Tepidisphaeraceae bacterium]|jgi:guanylate kinase|nr:guanylate kinase [Tepidisphaeraceae bacterium]
MANQSKKSGLLIILCGPSGVGKSTISRQLAERHSVTYIVSATTRPRRDGDEKGKTYEHISSDEFFHRLDANEFLEYAQVYGDYYGTPKHPAMDLLAEGKDILLEIDVQGALQVRFQYPQCLSIFILPPDEPTLLHRLEARARDSADEIAKRFRNAKREIHMAKGSRAFDYMVINDDLNQAVEEIIKIIKHKRSGGL